MIDAVLPMVLLLLKSTLLVLLASSLTRVMRKHGYRADHRYRVWLATFVLLSALPLLAPLAPSLDLPLRYEQLGLAGADLSTPGDHPPHALATWLMGIHLAGALVLAFQLLCARFMLSAVWRKATPWQTPQLELAKQTAGVHCRLSLRLTDPWTPPLTWGARVLLPNEAKGWSEPQLRHVLLHELSHMERADSRARLLSALVKSYYWFNPLVWVAWKALCDEQEQACDERVLSLGVNGQDYARTLLEVAASTGFRSPDRSASAMASHALGARIRNLLTIRTAPRLGRVPTAVLSLCLFCLVVLIALVKPVDSQRRLSPLGALPPLSSLTQGEALSTPLDRSELQALSGLERPLDTPLDIPAKPRR